MIDTTPESRTRSKDLGDILEKYLEKTPSIQAITVVSTDGLPIASTSDEKEMVIAAMTAASQSLSERVLSELEIGITQEIMLTGNLGFVILLNAGENAVVSITANDQKRIGLVRVVAKRLAKVISEML